MNQATRVFSVSVGADFRHLDTDRRVGVLLEKRGRTFTTRACRVGPDTKVEPSEQIAFYDAGLGSASDGGHFRIGWMRWQYNLASMATGLRITRNIVDCYAAIIALYEEGDRIFLIGFSRGAYTARSVAGAMTHCGVPRHMPDGSPLRRDPKSIHKLAEHAVKDVYQFCPSYSRKILGIRRFLLSRDAIAAQFRQQYGSTTAPSTRTSFPTSSACSIPSPPSAASTWARRS